MQDQQILTTYQTDNIRWRAADNAFVGWHLKGVELTKEGALQLDLPHAEHATDTYGPGEYNGRNFYNGGDFLVGEAVSPTIKPAFPFTEAIASWNAVTPEETWVEILLRARIDSRWTNWYNMGVWAASCSTVERHSVTGKSDEDGKVFTDNLLLNEGIEANACEVKIKLFNSDGKAVPSVHGAALALSTTPVTPSALEPGNPALWDTRLDVPQCSQMVYPDGGNVWCSAVSISMVLAYWAGERDSPCAQRVRRTVEGVYDWLYDGHGNWPFNVAYAATQGLEGYVARFTSLAQTEPFIADGVPVIISYAWKGGDLSGAAVPSSDGHLGVLVGFDHTGNPIVNDPAARTNDTVCRTYNRTQLETLWLRHSGGTVYIIKP